MTVRFAYMVAFLLISLSYSQQQKLLNLEPKDVVKTVDEDKFKSVISNSSYATSLLQQNCSIRKQDGCIKCLQGFYRYKDVCQPIQPKCMYWIPGTQNCTQCLKGTKLVNYTCVPNLAACEVITLDQICIKCKVGYKLNQGGCAQDFGSCSNSVQIKGQKICKSCSSGLKLSYGYCFALGQKACQFRRNGNCIKCINLVAYQLTNGNCVPTRNR